MAPATPIVLAERRGSQLVVTRCPFCKATHYHGGEPGPRTSHCTDRARRHEYTIVVASASAEEPVHA